MTSATVDRTAYLQQLALRLADAPHGERGSLVEGACRFLGVSRQSVYDGLRKVGWRSDRKQRCDQGDSEITDAELKTIAALMVESRRANNKQLMPCSRAVDIAVENGMLSRPLHPNSVHRLLRQRGLHPDQLTVATPHVQMKSKHPNHVHQVDVSVCVLFYLDNGGTAIMDEADFYKNKPKNLAKIVNKRVLRYALTDHCSGAFFVRYYQAAGEDQLTMFQFLMEAWHERPKQLLHGVPFILVWDKGSANTSHGIQNMLRGLGVEAIAHKTKNSRAKGQVERVHDLIERDLEGALYLIRVRDIDHLNGIADTWQIHYNTTKKHRRHGNARYAHWSKITSEQLRICPPIEICRAKMTSKPEDRTVTGNLTIRYAVKGFKPAEYAVGHLPDVRVGDRIQVTENPYHLPSLFAVLENREEGGQRFVEIEPIGVNADGFQDGAPVFGESMRSAPDTATDTHRKELEKLAWQADTEEEVAAKRAKREPAFGGEVDPFTYLGAVETPDYIRRPGTEIDTDSSHIELAPWSIPRVLMWLRNRLDRALTTDENARLRRDFPNGVPEEELEAVAARFEKRPPLRIAQ